MSTYKRRDVLKMGAISLVAAGIVPEALAADPGNRAAISSAPAEPGRWFEAGALPIAIQELYPAVHGNRLYVAGGIAARLGVPYFTNRCFSFDASSNAWREEPSLPEDLHHAALASNGKRLLLAGGFNGGYSHIWRMRDTVYELDDSGWTAGIALPQPQAEGVFAADASGDFHLVTGQSPTGEGNRKRGDHRAVREHWILPTGSVSWEALAPIPTPRNSSTGGWLGDLFVVTGGRTDDGNLAVTEIYDLREDRWRTAAPMPKPQAGTASVVVDNSLLIFGGEIFVPEADVFADCWRYDLTTDQWSALPNMRTPRHGLGAGQLEDSVYLIGGATQPSGRGTSDLNEALLLSSIT